MWILLALVLALRLGTFRDYGLTWDEEAERRNGALTVQWYASHLQSARFADESDQALYGSFANVLVRGAARASPLDYFETAHLVYALLGFLATAATGAIASSIAGPRAGLLAALALTLTPSFHGHSFNNPKDGPFAALFILALAVLLHPARDPGAGLTRGRVAALGIAVGLGAGVRFIGLWLLVPVAVLTAWQFREWGDRAARLRVVLSLVAVGAIAGLVALAWWPSLQASPWSQGADVLHSLTAFRWNGTVLFEGQHIRAHELPRRYLPEWLALSLPEFQMLALVAGMVLAARALRAGGGDADSRARVAVLVLAAGVPPAVAVAAHAVVYDGLRQFLFVLPPLAVLVGVSLDALARSSPSVAARALLGASLLSMAVTAGDMVRLHPYESIYFNRLVAGGMVRGAARYETDYWGSSYKEAVAWLVAHHAGPARVANVSAPFLTGHYLKDTDAGLAPVQRPESADIVLAITRWDGHRRWPGRILHVVRRAGVDLCYVIERAPK